jgi:general secretion pathway protein L
VRLHTTKSPTAPYNVFMSKLIVSLPYPSLAGNGNTSYSYVLSNDAQNRGKSGISTLSELPKADATILVVPARALSWHQVDLPKVPKARLRAALDGLLEERLLDDTSAMAFALSPEAQAGKAAVGAWVAACDKAWLSSAVQAFDAAGCRITQVVPEFWPQNEPQIVASGTPEEAWITRADAQGVMTVPLRAGDTSGVLGAVLANFPSETPVLAEPAVVTLAEEALSHKVALRQHAEGLLQSATSLWELAQFEQSLSGDSQGVKSVIRQWQNFWQSPAWRPVRWGLAALLLANIVGLNVWAWQQQSSLTAKRTLMNNMLTQSFPNVKTVVDAPLQMNRELIALRQSTGANTAQNFESMLSASGGANLSVAGVFITPTAIEYIANGINLKGIKLAGPELAAAQAKLKALGYTLTQAGDTASVKVQVAP